MTGVSSPARTEKTDTLGDLAPSAKLVAKALEYEGDLTQSQLADWTLLPARTVRHALSELEEHDIVTSRISFVDARKQVSSLADDDGDLDLAD